MKGSGTKYTDQPHKQPPVHKHPTGKGNKYPPNGVHKATGQRGSR